MHTRMCNLVALLGVFLVKCFLYVAAFAAVNRAVANSVPECLGRGLAIEDIFLLWNQQGELWVP